MGENDSAEPRPVGQLLLGGLGAVLLAAGLWGYFGAHDKLTGGFFVLVGVVLVVLAAFYPRIDGIVDLGLLKIPTLKARRAEKQIERGQLVAGANLDAVRKSLQETLSRYHGAAAAPVQLVEDAVYTMTTLTPHEQHLVDAEIVRMARPDFQPGLDPHATRPGEAERPYRMHRVPEADIRLWYRQHSEFEPRPLYLVVIEKTGEDLR